jgi:hypothetical protein
MNKAQKLHEARIARFERMQSELVEYAIQYGKSADSVSVVERRRADLFEAARRYATTLNTLRRGK